MLRSPGRSPRSPRLPSPCPGSSPASPWATTMILALKDAGDVLGDLGPDSSPRCRTPSAPPSGQGGGAHPESPPPQPCPAGSSSPASSSIGTFFAGIARASTPSSPSASSARRWTTSVVHRHRRRRRPAARARHHDPRHRRRLLPAPQLAQWFTNLSTRFRRVRHQGRRGRVSAPVDHRGVSALQDLGRVIGATAGPRRPPPPPSQRGRGLPRRARGRLQRAATRPSTAPSGRERSRPCSRALTTPWPPSRPGSRRWGRVRVPAPTLAQIMTLAGQAVALLEGLVCAAEPGSSPGDRPFQGILVGAGRSRVPALGAVAGTLDCSTLGTLAQTLGPVLGTAIQSLAPVFTALLTAVQPIIPVPRLRRSPWSSRRSPDPRDAAEAIANFSSAFPVSLAAVIAVVAAAFVALLPAIVSDRRRDHQLLSAPSPGPTGAFGGFAAIAGVLGTVFTTLGPAIAAVGAVVGVFLAGLAALAATLRLPAWSTSEPFRTAVMGLAQAFMGRWLRSRVPEYRSSRHWPGRSSRC
ncbi:hypothetical protein QJS66_02465 [Kocuria rhizophila]|nr:hypothetical protein QJS66_02465 [Kocuria rhizophila]